MYTHLTLHEMVMGLSSSCQSHVAAACSLVQIRSRCVHCIRQKLINVSMITRQW